MRTAVAFVLLIPLAVSAQTSAADSAFADEVRYRAELDQIVRQLPDVRYPSGTPRDSMDANVAGLWRAVDSLNTAWTRGVVTSRGWPKRSEVGTRAAFDFFLLVQHADLATQQGMLPLMEAAVAEDEAGGSEFAYLVDRVRVREGRPQVYGTQLRTVDGLLVPFPIDDEADVDARRESVGLEPLDAYLDFARDPDGHH